MRLLHAWFRTGRAFLATLLLTAFAVGAAADTWHHLSEQGCSADRGGREDHCVCTGLHAAPFASEPVTQVTPIECERTFVAVAQALAPVAQVSRAAVPRAPPRG
jgi:hypothetical protein